MFQEIIEIKKTIKEDKANQLHKDQVSYAKGMALIFIVLAFIFIFYLVFL